MMKSEFEQLSIRKNAGEITLPLYETIEKFYMSDNEYHQIHGGINETKQEFVKRVFGGKVNTPKTILKKIIDEAIRENTYCLQGTSNTKEDYDRMNACIKEHYTWLANQAYI